MSISGKPQSISSRAWYYEHPRSIEVIVECHGSEGYHKTLHVRIPARNLERSLARMDKPSRKGKKP